MRLPFTPSAKRATIGVEWELGLVDLRSRALVPAADDVLADVRPVGAEEHPRIKPEFARHTVEIITGICTTVDEATTDLAKSMSDVQSAAAARGLAVLGCGAHPFSKWSQQPVNSGDRYEAMVARHQNAARKFQTFGVHIHVGITDSNSVIQILNSITRYLPYLLSLSSSSPFWQGEDTYYASMRTMIIDGLSIAGLPPIFTDWRDYESLVRGLVTAGSIVDLRQLWWDARPHSDFGTLEIRICDGLSTFDEVATVTAISQCLVDRLAQQVAAGYTLPIAKSWIVRENKWRAARYGIDAHFIVDDSGAVISARDAIVDLVDDLMPTAYRLGCAAELAGVERILAIGACYQRQRAVADVNGGDLTKVVDHLIAELRDGLNK